MISKYKIMRGMLKRKFVRDIAFSFCKKINSKQYEIFINQKNNDIRTSIFATNESTIKNAANEVNQHGATLGLQLPKHIVDYVYSYALKNPVFADREADKGFYIHQLSEAKEVLKKDILLAQYFNILEDDTIRSIAEDPYLQLTAAEYLKTKPKLMGANLWWTFPSTPSNEDRDRHAHVYHYDLDDVKFIKFFIYITDVDMQSGPHIFVKGSNRNIRYKNSIVKSIRFSDKDILDWYGSENIITVTGPAGSTLIEDTITIHKGSTPISKPRLLLQFEFGINQYPEVSCECAKELQKFIV